MYHWVEDKEFLKRSYSLCADIVNQLVQNLKKYGIDGMNIVMNTCVALIWMLSKN